MPSSKASLKKTPPKVEEKQPESVFRIIHIAAQRAKQLIEGATPLVDLGPQQHKPTRIALEEVRQGKIKYKIGGKDS